MCRSSLSGVVCEMSVPVVSEMGMSELPRSAEAISGAPKEEATRENDEEKTTRENEEKARRSLDVFIPRPDPGEEKSGTVGVRGMPATRYLLTRFGRPPCGEEG